MERPKNVVATGDLPWHEEAHGPMRLRERWLAEAAGGGKIGTSLVELEPGAHSWPSHYHLANDEAVYVLAGSGTLRLGEKTIPIATGDYIAFPAGEPEAHHIMNDSSATLRYLAISTMLYPEVAYYADADKIGVRHGAPDDPKRLSLNFELKSAIDFWKGE